VLDAIDDPVQADIIELTMSKWTRTRRDPCRTYSDEETERTERMIARVRRFLAEGVAEDEPEFIAAVKAAKPKISSK
jgi:hypothetical protein